MYLVKSGNRNIGKGNGAGPARESQSHCFADHNMTTVKEIAEQCRRL